MEQNPKRRRLSQKEEPLRGHLESEHGRWSHLHCRMVASGTSGQQELSHRGHPPFTIPPDFSSLLNKSHRSGHATRLGNNSLPKLVPRGLGGEASPEPPLKTAIASVFQVVVDLPEKPPTILLIPPASSIISLEGFGTWTVDTNPTPSHLLPTQTDLAGASSSAYSASSSVHSANSRVHPADSAQQSSPSQAGRNSIPELPKTVDEPAHSNIATRTVLPSSASLKINLPGPGSQVVLLSPPSTPVPSDPPSSVLLEGTGSFHPTSPDIPSSSSTSRDTQKSPQSTSSPKPRRPKKIIGSAEGDSSISSGSIDIQS